MKAIQWLKCDIFFVFQWILFMLFIFISFFLFRKEIRYLYISFQLKSWYLIHWLNVKHNVISMCSEQAQNRTWLIRSVQFVSHAHSLSVKLLFSVMCTYLCVCRTESCCCCYSCCFHCYFLNVLICIWICWCRLIQGLKRLLM